LPPNLQEILIQFVPGARLDTWQQLGKGMIHHTYLAHSGAQSWVLQRLNTHVFHSPEQVMDSILRVQAHLKKSSYPYRPVEPLWTKARKTLCKTADGQVWRAFPYLQDTYTPEGSPDAGEAYEAAKAYGNFLSALRNFPAATLPETIPGFHHTMQRWEYYIKVQEQADSSRRRLAERSIARMEEFLPIFEAVHRMKTAGLLPLRITHNDTKAGNVLLDTRTRKAVAVIDLDTVMPGIILSDFGDMARTFAPNHPEDNPEIDRLTLRIEVLAALREGFLHATADWLTPAEKSQLLTGAVWISAEQALRFLTDYLTGDVYYQVQYPEHNLVRTNNQLKIAEKLREIAP
jgi:aminoglycoside phosphotransferase (APT) family kinase protein